MRKWILIFSALCLALLTGVITVSAQNDLAFIRVGHFAGDAPAVDVYLNGELSDVTGLTYGDVTPWIAIPAGTYSVAVTPEGEALDAAAAALDEVELEAGTWATISAVGSLANDTLMLQPAIEDYKTPIKDGQTRVSVFHAIEGMSGIDLVRKGAVMLSRVGFPNGAGSDGMGSVELPSGTFDFQITASGRTGAVIVDVPQLALTSGDYVSIFVYGTLDAPLYSLQTVTADDADTVKSGDTLDTETLVMNAGATGDTEQPSQQPEQTKQPPQPIMEEGTVAFIRVGHFASDAPAVDVYLNGELSDVQGVNYGEVTDWTAIPAGEYQIDVAAAGDTADNAVMSLEKVALVPGSWTTLSAVGSSANNTLRLQEAVEDYKTPIKDGQTRVSVFHAMEGMTGIDLVRNGAVMLSAVGFPNGAGSDGMGSVELPSGTYTLQITGSGRTSAVITDLPETVLESGSYVAIFVYGTLQEPLSLVRTMTAAEVEQLSRTR